MNLEKLRYSQVWEDHRLLEQGLCVAPDDDILSICSAGCNVLNLLLLGPRSITAIDMSPAQTALLELKMEGIRRLSHTEFVSLLGLRDQPCPSSSYERILQSLSPKSHAFWKKNRGTVERGIINAGRLEAYFREFQIKHLPKVWSPELVYRLLDAPDLETQRDFFNEGVRTTGFEELFRWYFGQEMMARHGRDPAQFRHVQDSDVGGYFFKRFSYVCTELPLAGNFYVEAFLTGAYRDLHRAHPYLCPKHFEVLKDRIDRVHIVHEELETFLKNVPAGSFNKGNFSDIFEYMSAELVDKVFFVLAGQFRPGGRIAYWNLLVPRTRPEKLAARLRPLRKLSLDLWKRDRSWFYRDFHIDEVLPG